MKRHAADLKRWALAGLVLFTLLAGKALFTEEPKSAEEILEFARSKAKGVKAFSVDFKQTMKMYGSEMVAKGTIIHKQPELLRMDIKMNMPAGMSQLMVMDGKTIWIEQKMNQKPVMAMKMDIAEMKELGGQEESPTDETNPFSRLQQLQSAHNVKNLGKTTLNGEEVYILEAIPKEPQPGEKISKSEKMARDMISKMKIYITSEKALLRRIEMYGKDGAVWASQDYSNYNFDIDPDPSLFTYTPPEGVTVTDMTEMMKAMAGKKTPEAGEGQGEEKPEEKEKPEESE